MKKWALIGAAVVLLVVVAVVGAQEALPNFEGFAQILDDIQANYRARWGEYAQILPTRGKAQPQIETRMKENGRQVIQTQWEALDTLTSPLCPSDQRGCPEALAVPENIMVAVNTYVSPQGEGYELVIEYIDELGQRWRMVQNFGPENWRERTWHRIDSDPLVSPVEEPTP